MARTHVRCKNCGLKPIDHAHSLCRGAEYRRISDNVVHPFETVADIVRIDEAHWKPIDNQQKGTG